MDSAHLLDEMARVKAKVDSLVLEHCLSQSSPIEEINLLYTMMRDYPERPGKGLRPLLCVATCKAFGGAEDDALLTAACLELLHNWILIHDDIEDASKLRRGAPTLHVKYGEALALNAGDALHAKMWGCLLDNRTRLGAATCLAVMEEFSNMVNETAAGQHMELAWLGGRRWHLQESDYLAMVGRKTAWYTVASPCRLGALIAGAAQPDIEQLADFGLKLGVGFQIRDDVLNLLGDASDVGTETATDIREGKRTLILLALLAALPAAEKARVTAILDKARGDKTDDDVRYVLSLMKNNGAIAHAQRTAQHLLEDALKVLDTIGWTGDPAAVRLLREVATFAIERPR